MKIYLDGKLAETFDISPTPRIVWINGVYYRHITENHFESSPTLLLKGEDAMLIGRDGKVITSNMENTT